MDPSFSLEPHYNTERFPYNENQGHTTVCVRAFEVLYFQGLFFRFFLERFALHFLWKGSLLGKYSFGKCVGAFSLLRKI